MAAQSQFRILGGLIAVSISATITTRYLQPHIRSLLPDQLANLLLQRTEAIQQLSGKTLAEVRVVFGEAYNREMYLAVGLAAACLSASATAWRAQQDKDATPSPTAEAQSADDFITKAEI